MPTMSTSVPTASANVPYMTVGRCVMPCVVAMSLMPSVPYPVESALSGVMERRLAEK